MSEAYDPWETDDGGVVSIVSRAQKRVDDVRRTSGRTFVVEGNNSLRDTYPEYEVTWAGGDQYECSCYSLEHGDSRRRKGCSHVWAVKLYREQVADGGSTNGKRVKATKQQHVQLEAPVDTHGPVASAVQIPTVSEQLWYQWDTQPLPSKFQEIHPHQWDAVQEIMDCYARGVEVVYLDAPTGTGKSFVAELVRRMLQQRAFYICHSKTLQQQFLTDFKYAKLLMGRANYETLDGPRDVTCADCTSSGPIDPCVWCSDKSTCPYQVAKAQAIASKLAILNTAYFLAEFNYVGKVGVQRGLGIIDECDTLEGELVGFAEFYLSDRLANKCRVTVPPKGSHRKTIAKWLVEEFKPALYAYGKQLVGDDLAVIRERMRVSRMLADVLRIGKQAEQDEGLTGWVRDNAAGPLVLKPVVVGDYGDKYVWKHAEKWLCMSATVISADELSDSCGLNGGDGEGEQGRRWEVVRVPMTFPVENRRIIVAPVADMGKKGKEAGEWEYAATALRSICKRHPGKRILVHTVSYELARYLGDRIKGTSDRPILTYTTARARDSVLARFRRTRNAVLIAASMDRGVDLAGDDCRVVVVAKVPFPNLGDPLISERMRMPGGQSWYAVQAVRKLVQMTGRATRSKDDWSVCYILDQQFSGNVLKKHRGLLPKWWQEALDMRFNVKELLRERD